MNGLPTTTESSYSIVGDREIGTVRVADVMHRGVLTCPPDAPLEVVAEAMASHRIHAVVTQARDGWGVVSDRDLVAAVASGRPERTAGRTAATEVVTVEPEESLYRAAQLMHEHDVSHLVVVDPDGGRPVGVLSTLDIARVLAATG